MEPSLYKSSRQELNAGMFGSMNNNFMPSWIIYFQKF